MNFFIKNSYQVGYIHTVVEGIFPTFLILFIMYFYFIYILKKKLRNKSIYKIMENP